MEFKSSGKPKVELPFLENATTEFAPGWSTTKTPLTLQGEIISLIGRLGGGGVEFDEGEFLDGKRKRYGYIVTFNQNGAPSVMQVAGLPIQSETPKRKQQALAQALYVVRMWLEAAVTSVHFSPGFMPLVQYMLVPGTTQTVSDWVLEQGKIKDSNPLLSDVITITPEVVR